MDRPVRGASMQVREALRLPAGLFSTLLESANDAVIVIDERHAIVLFNRGAERIFGYRAEDVLGEPVGLLLPENFSGMGQLP